MRILIAALTIVFAISIFLVAFINYKERVTFTLWPESPEYVYADTSVFWVVFLSAGAGCAFMGIIAVLEGSKTRLSNARLRVQVRKLQQEIVDLKRSALAGSDRDLALVEDSPVPGDDLEPLDEDDEDPEGRAGPSPRHA
jgi:hypothetical protein